VFADGVVVVVVVQHTDGVLVRNGSEQQVNWLDAVRDRRVGCERRLCFGGQPPRAVIRANLPEAGELLGELSESISVAGRVQRLQPICGGAVF